MEARKKRLTLDLDPMVQRRLKAVAAMKGISMRQYCLTTIGRELSKDEAQGVMDLPFGHEALDRLDALRKEIFGDGVLPRSLAGKPLPRFRATRERRISVLCGALLNEWEVVLSWRHEAKTASLQSSSQERRHHQEIPVSDT